MGFSRGRMDVKGQCGCAWSYVEPGVTEADEDATTARVAAEVEAHAKRLGHAPTIVTIRESFYTLEATPEQIAAFEASLAEK